MATEDQRRTLAHQIATEHSDHADYVQSTTQVLGVLQLGYGVLILTFGMRLWDSTEAYEIMRLIPFSPTSVGVVFTFLGLGILAFGGTRFQTALTGVLALSALAAASAAVTFLGDVILGDSPAGDGLTLAMFTGVVACLYLSRAWLSWRTSRRR